MDRGAQPYRATKLETASGLLRPGVADLGPLHEVPPGVHPLVALEPVLIAALQRRPCVVSFSGGQDSSAVLAASARVARREGLPPPIPVTLRFDGVASAGETGWQEEVVRHVGLPDWERVQIDHELDLVGPYAIELLRRHGPLWPFNTHFHVPVLRHARGGSLLTGIGGDELFARRRHRRLSLVLARQQRPQPRDALRTARAALPVGFRAAEIRLRRGFPAPLPWLDPSARGVVERRWYRAEASEPVRYDAAVRRTWWRSRKRLIHNTSLDVVASDHDVAVTHPLQAPPFLAAVMARVGAVGYPTRVEALRDIFGALLPSLVVERRTKATFDTVFWNRHSHAFARRWDGSGLDGMPVDPTVLYRIWRAQAPTHLLTWSLFQAVRLATLDHAIGVDTLSRRALRGGIRPKR